MTGVIFGYASRHICAAYRLLRSKSSGCQKKYLEIKAYGTKNSLGQQAAAVTYYKGFLWVASYSESNSGYLGSYRIANKTGKPVLTVCGRIKLPNRVQGLTFTSNGRLILSRSCQTNSTKRGYLHQLDVYKPNLKKQEPARSHLANAIK